MHETDPASKGGVDELAADGLVELAVLQEQAEKIVHALPRISTEGNLRSKHSNPHGFASTTRVLYRENVHQHKKAKSCVPADGAMRAPAPAHPPRDHSLRR
jgi:hypothetical protein